MGNFFEKVESGLRCLGRCVCRVLIWFVEFLEQVTYVVKAFLYKFQNTIINADNPQRFGECVAIKKELEEVTKKANESYNSLTENDKNRINQIFNNSSY
jgi:hypothetical protein